MYTSISESSPLPPHVRPSLGVGLSEEGLEHFAGPETAFPLVPRVVPAAVVVVQRPRGVRSRDRVVGGGEEEVIVGPHLGWGGWNSFGAGEGEVGEGQGVTVDGVAGPDQSGGFEGVHEGPE